MKRQGLELEILLERANKGDQRAYSEFLQLLSPILLRFISKKVSRADEADDILQEILLSIHRARHTYDNSRPLLPWVYAIAKFRLADHLRKTYQKAPEINIDDIPEIPQEDVTNSLSFYESIRKEISNLSSNQPKILELMHFEGFTAKEIGIRLGMKESTVKVTAHRAYKILRKKLSA
jgi:RNA polymerase sigma-70 factor (ECF subfamily)